MLSVNTFDSNHLKSLLNNDYILNTNYWEQVDDFNLLRDVKKMNCGFANKSGIYILIDEDGDVAYLGKAKCLHNRLSSHSNSLIGKDEFKAPAWHQFFSYFHNNKIKLQARYVIIEGFRDPANSELGRRAIECTLQIIYQPYFDKIYHAKKGKVSDFEKSLADAKAITAKKIN